MEKIVQPHQAHFMTRYVYEEDMQNFASERQFRSPIDRLCLIHNGPKVCGRGTSWPYIAVQVPGVTCLSFTKVMPSEWKGYLQKAYKDDFSAKFVQSSCWSDAYATEPGLQKVACAWTVCTRSEDWAANLIS